MRQLLRAHEYWRMKQLAVDLVILNERASSYVQDLQIALETLVRTSQSRPQIGADGARGAVFVLRADLISRGDARRCCSPCARAVLVGAARHARPSSSTGCATRRRVAVPRADARACADGALRRRPGAAGARVLQRPRRLRRGRPRVRDDPRRRASRRRRRGSTSSPIRRSASRSRPRAAATPGRRTAARTSSRRGRTIRSPTARARRSTCATRRRGELWGPTALPIRDAAAPYVARHGQGYSRFEHAAHGIALELLQYVPLDDPIKISRLTIRNTSRRARRLSVTAYVEWVLGPSRGAVRAVRRDRDRSAKPARCSRATPGASRSARASPSPISAGRQTAGPATGASSSAATARSTTPRRWPADAPLSGAVGAGLDPVRRAADAGRARARTRASEIVFFLGQAATADEARALIARYRAADLDAVLREVAAHWDDAARRGPGEDAGPRRWTSC